MRAERGRDRQARFAGATPTNFELPEGGQARKCRLSPRRDAPSQGGQDPPSPNQSAPDTPHMPMVWYVHTATAPTTMQGTAVTAVATEFFHRLYRHPPRAEAAHGHLDPLFDTFDEFSKKVKKNLSHTDLIVPDPVLEYKVWDNPL